MSSVRNNILFVLPSISIGGTTTAMSGILNSSFCNNKQLDVFAIIRGRLVLFPVSDHEIGNNSLTTAFYGDYALFDRLDRFKYLPIKLLKQIPKFRDKLETIVLKKTVARIERERHYDYVVGFQEGLATRVASQFSCNNKIAWVHCDYARAFGTEGAEGTLYECFKKIVCVSEFTRNTFIDTYPQFANRSVAIHNLFDARRIIQLSTGVIDDERFDCSSFTVISLGRICEVKRFYLIPSIVSKVKAFGRNLKWYILGVVNEQEELSRLEREIRRFGVQNDVIYLGPKANPYPYLKASSIMATLSMSEACPMIFNEAKLLQVPILSADFGSAFEFIENGKTGYISTIEDMPVLLSKLISDRQLLNQVRIEGVANRSNELVLRKLDHLFTT